MYCWSWLYLIIILEYEGEVPGDVIANYTDLSITGVNTGELQGGPVFEFSYDFQSSGIMNDVTVEKRLLEERLNETLSAKTN